MCTNTADVIQIGKRLEFSRILKNVQLCLPGDVGLIVHFGRFRAKCARMGTQTVCQQLLGVFERVEAVIGPRAHRFSITQLPNGKVRLRR